jgi:hypothetical protein
MPEYIAIRILLGFTLIWLARREMPASMRQYLTFMAGCQVLRQDVLSQAWSHNVWLFISVAQIAMNLVVCKDLYWAQTSERTFLDDRRRGGIASILFGLATIAMIWRWVTGDPLSEWTVINQYIRAGTLVGWLAPTIFYGVIRPLKRSGYEPLLMFWTVWLTCQAVMSTAGNAGLLWRFIPQTNTHEIDPIYRMVGDFGMIIQTVAAVAAGIKLRRSEWHPANV